MPKNKLQLWTREQIAKKISDKAATVDLAFIVFGFNIAKVLKRYLVSMVGNLSLANYAHLVLQFQLDQAVAYFRLEESGFALSAEISRTELSIKAVKRLWAYHADIRYNQV